MSRFVAHAQWAGVKDLSCSLLLVMVPWLLGGCSSTTKPAPDFDCGVRRLAYEFGCQLLPRMDNFGSLHEALGLNTPDCTVEWPDDSAKAAKDGGFGGRGSRKKPAGTGTGLVPTDAVFVDPYDGDDANSGTIEWPLRTVQAAIDLATDSASARSGTRTVLLRGGTHALDKTILVEPRHSGVTVESFPGESAVLSGGKTLKDLRWEPVDLLGTRNIWRAYIGDQAPSEGVSALMVDGTIATRARYPNLPHGVEVSPGYDYMINGNKAEWHRPREHEPPTYHEDNWQNHTRGWMAPWFDTYRIGTGGQCSTFDPPVSYWCAERPQGGGAFQYKTPSGITPQKGVLPNSPYASAIGAVFNVWRPARWANWMFEVDNFDTTSGGFNFSHGGFQGARGDDAGGDWFIENVREELDYPGEFFYDDFSGSDNHGHLFLFYNGTGPPPITMDLVVPDKRVLVNVSGTRFQPVRNFTLRGVVLRATRPTYMDPHAVPSAGDWALDRQAAVFLQGTEGSVVEGCVFDRLHGNGLMISGYSRGARVLSNDFSFIGGSAIISWGYTNETASSGYPYYTPNTNYPQAGVDGTDGNHPEGTEVVSNSGREIGLYEKQSSFYMQAKTTRSNVQGNVFFNGPRAGINFNDGFGGGDRVGWNLVFSTCRESGDHGPLNSWDRQPYLTIDAHGRPSLKMAWREIHNNMFIDNYSPQENIDNDDGSGFYRSHHNFLVYGGAGLKSDFGGHDNYHFSNLYAYVGSALQVDQSRAGHEDRFFNNTVVLTGSSVGKPQCGSSRTFMANNSYFTGDGTLEVCGKPLKDAQEMGMDLGSHVAKTPRDDDILSWARSLLAFPLGHAIMAD